MHLPKLVILMAGFLLLVIICQLPLTRVYAAAKVPILMYHYIGNNPNPKDLARNTLSVTPDKFEAQMDYLSKQGYTAVSLDTLAAIFSGAATAPAKPIVLTFDDGYIDFYLNAYPILRKYNFSAVEFIATGLIGQPAYMTWAQIEDLQNRGGVTFEAHSITHPNLSILSQAAARNEIKTSKDVIFSHTHYPVNFFAYPYGATNASLQSLVKQAGFVGALGTWFGKSTGINFNMPRIRITGQMKLSEFASKL